MVMCKVEGELLGVESKIKSLSSSFLNPNFFPPFFFPVLHHLAFSPTQ